MIVQRLPTSTLAIATLVLSVVATPVSANTCAAEPVTARGEIARFEWLAKTKARANWRRKVREMAALGPDYAQWAAAETTTERCIKVDKSVYCIFSGSPCRR